MFEETDRVDGRSMFNVSGMFSSLTNLKKLFKDSQIGAIMAINIVLAVVVLSKEILLAAYLGTSPEADAFLLAYFIPDTVGNNVLASALAVACVPVFARLYADNQHVRLRQIITGLAQYITVFSLLLLAGTYLARDLIIGWLGAGFSQETLNLTVKLLEIILPSIVLYPLIGMGIASLQVHNNFKIPALAPVLFNGLSVGAILYVDIAGWPIGQGVYVLSLAILFGTLAVIAFVWVNERVSRLRSRKHNDIGFDDVMLHGIRQSKSHYADFWRGFFPYLLILLFAQAVYFVERHLVAGLGAGTVAGLNYAYRLAQFPLWVFVAAISAVVFPSMAKDVGKGRMVEMRESFAKAWALILAITLPLTIVFFGLREPIVSLVLQRGSFGTDSVKITTEIIAGYALAIVFQGLTVLGLRVCLALRQTRIALISGLMAAVVNILFDFALVKPWGAAGLGYGATLGAIVNCAILFFLLAKVPELELRPFNRAVVRKIMLASIPIAAATWVLAKLWLQVGPNAGILLRYGYGLLATVVLLSLWGLTLGLRVKHMN